MSSSDDDAVAGAVALARIRGGERTVPAEVLALMLDDGLSPLAAWRRHRGLCRAALAEKGRTESGAERAA